MSSSGETMATGDFFSGNIASSDSLGNIISQIFGNGWAQIGTDTIFGGATESASMVIAVLGALNIVALNVGAVLLFWLAFQATIGTAHEGAFLGKRFHSVWAPLRSGLVVTFLAPVVKGGLCVIQVVGLILIGCSIQVSNYLQNVGLDYMNEHSGRVIALSVPPAMHENTTQLAKGLLRTLVVQYHYKYNKNKTFKPYTVKNHPEYGLLFRGPNVILGRQQVLSSVTIPKYETSSGIALARAKAVQKMYHTLSPLALSIITKSSAEYENVPANIELLEQSINQYIADVAPQMGELLSDKNPDFKAELQRFVDRAKQDGAFWLGAYYPTISRYAGKVQAIAAEYPGFNAVSLGKISEDVNILLESALTSVKTIEESLAEKKDAAMGTNPVDRFLDNMSYSVTSYGIDYFVKSVIEGDPLANLANKGHAILVTAETIVASYLIAYGVAKFADGVSDSWAGKVAGFFTGGTADGATDAATGLLSKIWTLVLYLVVPLTSLGFMLAIYLPSVPYIIWMSGMIGCLIQWIEFLVIMPIWAITFASGEGEGIAGQRSQQGLLLIANALLRLPLMVIGFMIAVVLMPLVGKVIGLTFMVFVGGMTAEHTVGLPTMIATWFVFSSFIILQSHVVFGLVTHLPDNAMKFFGGAVSSMGEAANEAKTRAMVMSSLGKGESAVQSTMSTDPPDPGNAKGDKLGKDDKKQTGNHDVTEKE